jgi:hypothetical protein
VTTSEPIAPASELLTVRRGKGGALRARREAIVLARARSEANIEMLDEQVVLATEQVAKATSSALQARLTVAACDKEIELIDAALSEGGEV